VIQEVTKLGQVITVLTLTAELEMTISWKAVTIDKPAGFLSCSCSYLLISSLGAKMTCGAIVDRPSSCRNGSYFIIALDDAWTN
jgi:hypothetical protein